MRSTSLLFCIVVTAFAYSSAFQLPQMPIPLRSSSSKTNIASHIAYAPLIAAVIFSSTLVQPSIAIETGSVPKGQQIFTSTCAGCHGGGQNFVKANKTLQKDALTKFVGGTDQEKVEGFFRGSMVHMKNPTIGGKLNDGEITDVVSYVVDQATNEKW